MRSIQLTKIYDLGTMLDLISIQLRGVHVFLSSNLNREVEARGLRSGAVSALSLIEANPGISQNEVGRSIGIDRSTMVELMDLLHQRGWVTRKKSSDDRRRYALYVTDNGRASLREIVATVRNQELEMLEGFPPEDLERFHELLGRMRDVCIQTVENNELSGEREELTRTV
jgi:DNA-binding MarR family transcriptional regulator